MFKICKNCKVKDLNAYGECRYWEPLQRGDSCANFVLIDQEFYEDQIRNYKTQVQTLEKELKEARQLSSNEYEILIELNELFKEMDSQPESFMALIRYIASLKIGDQE